MGTEVVSNPVKLSKVLIVDDDHSISSQLELSLEDKFDVLTADNPEAAWQLVQAERPELITLDLSLVGNDPESGFSLLEKCLRFDPFTKIVMITGNDELTNAQRAVQQGAADFFGKPVDAHVLEVTLERLLKVSGLERQNAEILKQHGEERRLGSLLGISPEMQKVFRTIERVATADVAVLVLGESGTGKELVTKEIRRLSSRATKPFVSINCGAIPENLLESELFGHEKGSFTGAHASRMGRLEMADGGIVFLDEVAEMTVPLQVKLLRFLQDHEIERVGGRQPIELNVRVVAATNKNLEERVAQGLFREDLYYRLSVVNIQLPPLRERAEDIVFLAQYFLECSAKEFGRGGVSFSADARRALRAYTWPGNVRELEHKVQKAVLMSNGRTLAPKDLGLNGDRESTPATLRETRMEADRQAVEAALRATAGNISEAAKVLEISRPSLHELLTKLEVNAKDYKPRKK